MKVITLRDIPADIKRLIQKKAEETGLSFNRTVLRLLRECLEFESGKRERRIHDLDHLAGAWSDREAAEFEKGLAAQRRIDDELWQ